MAEPTPNAPAPRPNRRWWRTLGDLWVAYLCVGLITDVLFVSWDPTAAVFLTSCLAAMAVLVKFVATKLVEALPQPRYAVFTHDTPEGDPPPGMTS